MIASGHSTIFEKTLHSTTFHLVIYAQQVRLRCLREVPRVDEVSKMRPADARGTRISESSGGLLFTMNESEERTGVDPRRDVPRMVPVSGVEGEEPPGKPRRLPLWRNVPAKQRDD